MNRARLPHVIAGTAVTFALALAAAWLSASPDWESLGPDQALVRISFTHGGDRSASCRDRTEEELAALPQNMRRKQICDRSRPPVYVELDMDGSTVLTRNLPPSGLSGTGTSRIYQRIEVPAGAHHFVARLRDNPATQGFDYTGENSITLNPGQSFVIEFDVENGGFQFK
ncbi:MAG: hypothetical protein ACK5MY_11640 [Jhaorihella sp.]